MVVTADSPTVRRIWPETGSVTSLHAAYDRDRPAPPDRPWVGVLMITSLDGSIAVDGASGGLGNTNDAAVLGVLRAHAEVIVVGAGTVRAEGYGPPRKPGQRIAVATNSGSLDLDSELFTSGSGFVLAPAAADVDESRVEVLRAGDDRLDLTTALARLREVVPGTDHVLAEGGPGLNGSLLDADLVDELTMTLSPHLVGGRGDRLTRGAGEAMRRFRLDQLLVDDESFVFGRWLRDRDQDGGEVEDD